MAHIATEIVKVTTAGSAGSATGSSSTPSLMGKLLAIYLDFHASAPAGTTDTTVSYAKYGGNILAVSNSATDALFHPRSAPVNNANSAITNAFDYFPLQQPLTVTVAQSDALTDCVTAYIIYESL